MALPDRFSGFMEQIPPESLGYARSRLDRQANRRAEADFLAGERARPEARAVVVFTPGDTIALRPAERGGALHSFAEAEYFGAPSETLYLGRDIAEGFPIFALAMAPPASNPEHAAADETTIVDLRSIASQGLAPAADLGMLATARAMVSWHASHCFCSRCGAPSHAADGGWKRICEACGGEHFPRTDPVVIMLAVRGDHCLLGRQPRFPQGMYSALAGFMEPGETIEDAVRREIAEEAGIACGAVRYLGSQPWAFPMSLMIGALAEATSETIAIDRQELEDARWFHRDEIRLMLEKRHPDGLLAPNPIAIAHHLLRVFVEQASD